MKKQKNQLKIAKEENPLPEYLQGKKMYTLDEVIENGYKRLSELYGVDFHTLK